MDPRPRRSPFLVVLYWVLVAARGIQTSLRRVVCAWKWRLGETARLQRRKPTVQVMAIGFDAAECCGGLAQEGRAEVMHRIVDVIVWCHHFAVREIILFDPDRDLVSRADALAEMIKDRAGVSIRLELCPTEGVDGRRVTGPEEEPKRWRLGSEVTTVRLASRANGTGAIVKYANHFVTGKAPVTKTAVTCALSEDPLGIMLGKEPELLIAFGSEPRVTGFPPWELRLTQLFLCEKLESFTRERLQRILEECSATPRRFGR